MRGPPCAYRAVGAEIILPRSGAATTISFRVHAHPTPALSPDGGEGDEGSEHEGQEVRGPLTSAHFLPGSQRVEQFPVDPAEAAVAEHAHDLATLGVAGQVTHDLVDFRQVRGRFP